jgi:hypothetical protein
MECERGKARYGCGSKGESMANRIYLSSDVSIDSSVKISLAHPTSSTANLEIYLSAPDACRMVNDLLAQLQTLANRGIAVGPVRLPTGEELWPAR